jgi:hypothetical protein
MSASRKRGMSRRRAARAARPPSVPTGCWLSTVGICSGQPVHVGLTFHSSGRHTRRATAASSRFRAYA